jgi:hypothetical protein
MILPLLLLVVSAAAAESADPLMAEYNRVWALEGQARRGEAIAALKSIVAKEPRFFRAYKTLVVAFFHGGAVQEGLAYFHDLAQRDPGNPYPHLGACRNCIIFKATGIVL